MLLSVSFERHRDFGRGRLELRSEIAVAWVGLDEIYVLVECQNFAACVVEFGAPVGSAGLVGLGCAGGGVEAVLLAAERADYINVPVLAGSSRDLPKVRTHTQPL